MFFGVETELDEFDIEAETKSNEPGLEQRDVKDELHAVLVAAQLLEGFLVGEFAHQVDVLPDGGLVDEDVIVAECVDEFVGKFQCFQ